MDYSWPCRLLHLGAREHDEDISAGLGKLGHLGREKVDRWTIQEQVDNTGAGGQYRSMVDSRPRPYRPNES